MIIEEELKYGIVKIIGGFYSGRIGYYDDDDYLFDEYLEEEADIEEEVDIEEEEKVAIVYFGEVLLAPERIFIPHSLLSHVTMYDLVKRKEELYKICSPYYIKNQTDHETLNSYFSELHFVETILLERLVEQRYMDKPTGSKIFISHSSIDKGFAKLLCMDLEAKGHVPWLDEWDIQIGESIPEKVYQGLKDADFIIVILSKNSVVSKWVEREWQTKYWSEIEKGKIQVLPLLLQDCEIPELLKTKKYADFRFDFNNGLRSLLSAIEHFLK